MKAFIVLEGVERGNRFITSSLEGETPEDAVKLHNGNIAYRLLGEFDTILEAQKFLFGPHYEPR